MDVTKTFLDMTKYLTPYKHESMLEPFFPENIIKDEIGNYYIKIGKSKSMFCCHLDTVGWKPDKITQILYDNDTKVKTDGKTPLGSDDKAGVTILLNMIEHQVPGLYYFFIGEECGVIGSKGIFKMKPERFKDYDRCVEFDRRGYSSIISRQSPGVCCSQEFVKALSDEFAKQGLEYRDDPTGIYTDCINFMYTIPEVTNISTGGHNEHHQDEWQDLAHLEKLAKATININWENLPIVRSPKIQMSYNSTSRSSSNVSKFDVGDLILAYEEQGTVYKILSPGKYVIDYGNGLFIVYEDEMTLLEPFKPVKSKKRGIFNFDSFKKNKGRRR